MLTEDGRMTIERYDLAAADPRIMFSPFCWRVRMALLHKGLDFTVVPWRFSDRSATAASGDDPTYADYVLFGLLKWTDIVSPYRPIEGTGPVGEWFERLQNLYGGYAASVPTVRAVTSPDGQ
jgi:glutathione S-transferase